MAPMNTVLRSIGFDADEARITTAVFSAIHDFATLRGNGLFTLPGDPDVTLQRIARLFAREAELTAAEAV